MIERLQKIIQEKNMTASQFAEALGIQRSGLSHILSGRNQPSLEFIKKLLHRFPDVDIYWLITGESSPQPQYKAVAWQSDLFSQAEPNDQKPVPEKLKPSESPSAAVKNEPVAKKTEEILRPGQRTSSRSRVKKIILLYEDGTYEVMIPSD